LVEEEPVGDKEGEYVDSMVGSTDVVEGAAGGGAPGGEEGFTADGVGELFDAPVGFGP
jgi:hypothetical protein